MNTEHSTQDVHFTATPEPATELTTEIDTPIHPLIPTVSLENFVRQRAAVLERLELAISQIQEAHAIAEAAHLGTPQLHVDGPNRHSTPVTDSDALEAVRKQIDLGGRSYLMSESRLLTFMDAKAREDWRKQLESDALPELTPENICSTFAHVHSTREEMFDRGVISLFRRLSWDYKTNLPFRFGKRLVLRYLLTLHGNDHAHAFVNHTTADELDGLLRVFHVLDGKPQADHRQGFYRLLAQALTDRETDWEGDYFHLRWFKKGSGHLTFKRPDLVDELNRILARHYPRALAADNR